jgi:hypothetical protein
VPGVIDQGKTDLGELSCLFQNIYTHQGIYSETTPGGASPQRNLR